MATDGYCVKCKTKRTMKDDKQDHDEERQARHAGHLSRVRDQDVQDRRLSARLGRSGGRKGRPPSQRLTGRRAPLGGRSVFGR